MVQSYLCLCVCVCVCVCVHTRCESTGTQKMFSSSGQQVVGYHITHSYHSLNECWDDLVLELFVSVDEKLELAGCYETDSGAQFWDNNRGENFSVSR